MQPLEDFVDLLLPTVRSMEGGEEQVVAGHPRIVDPIDHQI